MCSFEPAESTWGCTTTCNVVDHFGSGLILVCSSAKENSGFPGHLFCPSAEDYRGWKVGCPRSGLSQPWGGVRTLEKSTYIFIQFDEALKIYNKALNFSKSYLAENDTLINNLAQVAQSASEQLRGSKRHRNESRKSKYERELSETKNNFYRELSKNTDRLRNLPKIRINVSSSKYSPHTIDHTAHGHVVIHLARDWSSTVIAGTPSSTKMPKVLLI